MKHDFLTIVNHKLDELTEADKTKVLSTRRLEDGDSYKVEYN